MTDVEEILLMPMDDPSLIPRLRAAVEGDEFTAAMAIFNGEMTDGDRMRICEMLLMACPPEVRGDLLAAFNIRSPWAPVH